MNRYPPLLLRLERRLFREIVDHLNDAKPAEGVGLLAGVAVGGERRATRFFPGTNLDASPTRYTMDPAEVIAAFGEMAARGWELVAIVHSHPATSPTPSATDVREAHYPEALLLILGLASSPPVARCWLLARAGEGDSVGSMIPWEIPVLVDDGERLDSRRPSGEEETGRIPPLPERPSPPPAPSDH